MIGAGAAIRSARIVFSHVLLSCSCHVPATAAAREGCGCQVGSDPVWKRTDEALTGEHVRGFLSFSVEQLVKQIGLWL